MAQECNRTTELFSALVSVLVAATLIDDFLIFLKICVYVCKELLRKVEFREDRILVNLEAVDLIGNFKRVCKDLRMVEEHLRHLFLTLEILLLGISHSIRIVHESICSKTDESVMSLAVLLANEVYVVCSDNLCSGLFRQFIDAGIRYDLSFIYFLGLSRDFSLVLLHLQIEILSEYSLVPLNSLYRTVHVTGNDRSWNLTCDTC